jgi:hypothetical protein
MAYDASRHQELIELLARTDFASAYLELCTKHSTWVGIDGPRIDMTGLNAIFCKLGVKAAWHK